MDLDARVPVRGQDSTRRLRARRSDQRRCTQPRVSVVGEQRFDRLREQAEELLHATDPGTAFFGFFRCLVADAAGKNAIGEALREAGGDDGSDAARASDGLRRAVGALLRQAQRTGAVRGDVELPEVYALLVATSRASAHAHLAEEVRDRMLAIVFDGLAPAGPAQDSHWS